MRIYENGVYRDMTQEEIDEMQQHQEEIKYVPSLEQKLNSLEEANQMLTDCILEMSEILYQ